VVTFIVDVLKAGFRAGFGAADGPFLDL